MTAPHALWVATGAAPAPPPDVVVVSQLVVVLQTGTAAEAQALDAAWSGRRPWPERILLCGRVIVASLVVFYPTWPLTDLSLLHAPASARDWLEGVPPRAPRLRTLALHLHGIADSLPAFNWTLWHARAAFAVAAHTDHLLLHRVQLDGKNLLVRRLLDAPWPTAVTLVHPLDVDQPTTHCVPLSKVLH